MYGSVPPIAARPGRPAGVVSSARLKSSSIGWPSSVEQDVGRLQVAVQDAAVVGVGQPVGQLRPPSHSDRLDVGQPRRASARAAGRARRRRRGRAVAPRTGARGRAGRVGAVTAVRAVLRSSRPDAGHAPAGRRSSSSTSARVVAPKYGMQTAWSGPARWTE